MALSKWPLKGWIFCTQGAKNETPPETLKLKVREVSQIGFWNISWQPTSVPSFSQIGWPQVLAPGTLSQTMTLKNGTSPVLELVRVQQQISIISNRKHLFKEDTFMVCNFGGWIVSKLVVPSWMAHYWIAHQIGWVTIEWLALNWMGFCLIGWLTAHWMLGLTQGAWDILGASGPLDHL